MEERLGKPKIAYKTNCRISHRPVYRTEEPVFFRCPVCGSVIVKHIPKDGIQSDNEILCCGTKMIKLELTQDPQLKKEHEMAFAVFGGFFKNTIRLTVDDGMHPMDDDHHIEWMYLRTYQGGQIKYLPLHRSSAAMFMMAEEDSYVYCNREVCRMGWEHCQFQCKRLNIGYAYCNKHGLFRIVLGIYSED